MEPVNRASLGIKLGERVAQDFFQVSGVHNFLVVRGMDRILQPAHLGIRQKDSLSILIFILYRFNLLPIRLK